MEERLNHNLQIYARCNHRCKMCLASNYIHDSGQVSWSQVKNEILRIGNAGYQEITFAGSESSMYPDLFKAIKYAQSIGLKCVISTNGNKFSSVEFTKKFLKFKPIVFKIAFHSHKKQSFNYITGTKGSYEKVLMGIDNISKYLTGKKINYSKMEIKKGLLSPSSMRRLSEEYFLFIDIPINKFNYKDLPRIVEFLHRRGIKTINLFQLSLEGNLYSHPEMIIGLDSIRPFLAKAVTLAKKLKMLYFLGRMPICLLEKEATHFTRPNHPVDYIKLIYCKTCQYCKRCYGINKLSLIARYGRQLLTAEDLFPDKFFRAYFTPKDLSFIKRI